MTDNDSASAAVVSQAPPSSVSARRPHLWVMWANAVLSWSVLPFVYLIYLTIRNINWSRRNSLPWFRYAAPIVTVIVVAGAMVPFGLAIEANGLNISAPATSSNSGPVTAVTMQFAPTDRTTLGSMVEVITQRLREMGVNSAQVKATSDAVVVTVSPAQRSLADTLVPSGSRLTWRPVLLVGSRSTPPDPNTPRDLAPGSVVEDVQGFLQLDCDRKPLVDPAPPSKTIVACDQTAMYVLGSAELSGSSMSSATISARNSQSTAGLLITLTPTGAATLANVSRQLIRLPSPRNQLALVLDNEVLLAPVIQAVSTAGQLDITSGSGGGDMARRISAAIPLHLRLTRISEVHGN